MYQQLQDSVPPANQVPATASSAEVVIASPIDYRPRAIESPWYKYHQVSLFNHSTNSITIGASTNTLLEFKLPTLVYNLARSYVQWTEDIPGAPNKGIVTHEDVFNLGSSITFGAAGGLNIVDLQWAQNYTKIRSKIDTPMDEYLTNDETSGLYKSGKAVADNLVPYVATAAASPSGTAFHGAVDILENRYCKIGLLGAGAQNYRRMPLSMFTGTLLGLDRDFYGGNQEMYLRINAGTGDKMAYTTDNIANPATGAASIPSLTINNVCLFLAVEQNPRINADFLGRFARGTLKYTIPFTTAFKQPGGAANAQTNIQIQLSAQYGKRLKRIIHTVWNPAEKLNTVYDCNNYNGIKIVNYRTLLDSLPVQNYILSCKKPELLQLNGDDWLENKKFLGKNSMIFNKGHYYLNWFHMDSFLEPNVRETEAPDVNFVNEGLSMHTARDWQFSALTGATAGLMHYTFAEFSRVIDVNPVGVIFI